MADGTCRRNFYLSCLDPGVGKTSAVKHFVRHLLGSSHHQDVAVLVCLTRKAEIKRLIEDMGLLPSQFAVLTSDKAVNALSPTPKQEARVLFTTHQMVRSRCGGGSFTEVEKFHFKGLPRKVRIWDEEMLLGEVVTLSADALGSLLAPLRSSCPKLAALVSDLQQAFNNSAGKGTFSIPDIPGTCGVDLRGARRALGYIPNPATQKALEDLFSLSGRTVRLFEDHRHIISALDTREPLPSDFAPVAILDASGRVRYPYELWEKGPGGLVRLKDAPKSYCDLSIEVLEQGGSKSSWYSNGDQLFREIIAKLNTKPNERWLVIHQKDALQGKLPKHVQEMVQGAPDLISFLHWGAHQGTNAYSDITNVILAGTLFLPDCQYIGLTHLSAKVPITDELPDVAIRKTRLGEHQHFILQGLCRASVRGSNGDKCKPCNAYIIAANGSGIRGELAKTFPGCTLSTWRPIGKKLKGQKAEAIYYVRTFFENEPDGILLLADLRKALGITDASNFNRVIRKHEDFKIALEAQGVDEVTTGKTKYPNALQRRFSAVPGATCFVEHL
ncbi:MAG: hypothetical protein COB16_09655 [Rhodobacteraceae bacterium]|nr:MAG: hypothetical protein COB16_09655 [Paracoccaceae bacterium]